MVRRLTRPSLAAAPDASAQNDHLPRGLLSPRLSAVRNPALAREHLAQAQALVQATGYHRCDAEIETLARALETHKAD
jgi:hypothetical protein